MLKNRVVSIQARTWRGDSWCQVPSWTQKEQVNLVRMTNSSTFSYKRRPVTCVIERIDGYKPDSVLLLKKLPWHRFIAKVGGTAALWLVSRYLSPEQGTNCSWTWSFAWFLCARRSKVQKRGKLPQLNWNRFHFYQPQPQVNWRLATGHQAPHIMAPCHKRVWSFTLPGWFFWTAGLFIQQIMHKSCDVGYRSISLFLWCMMWWGWLCVLVGKQMRHGHGNCRVENTFYVNSTSGINTVNFWICFSCKK